MVYVGSTVKCQRSMLAQFMVMERARSVLSKAGTLIDRLVLCKVDPRTFARQFAAKVCGPEVLVR